MSRRDVCKMKNAYQKVMEKHPDEKNKSKLEELAVSYIEGKQWKFVGILWLIYAVSCLMFMFYPDCLFGEQADKIISEFLRIFSLVTAFIAVFSLVKALNSPPVRLTSFEENELDRYLMAHINKANDEDE